MLIIKQIAILAENYILITKRRLYKLLRGTLSQNWVDGLRLVTKSLNETPLKRLGWLTPNDITSEVGSVLVDRAKKLHHLPIEKEPTFQQQQENTENYSGDLSVGDYVYKDFDAKLFDKSFDVSVIMAFSKIQLFVLFCPLNCVMKGARRTLEK